MRASKGPRKYQSAGCGKERLVFSDGRHVQKIGVDEVGHCIQHKEELALDLRHAPQAQANAFRTWSSGWFDCLEGAAHHMVAHRFEDDFLKVDEDITTHMASTCRCFSHTTSPARWRFPWLCIRCIIGAMARRCPGKCAVILCGCICVRNAVKLPFLRRRDACERAPTLRCLLIG